MWCKLRERDRELSMLEVLKEFRMAEQKCPEPTGVREKYKVNMWSRVFRVLLGF